MNDKFNELLEQQHELIQQEAGKLTLTTARLEEEISQSAAARDFNKAAQLQKELEQLLQKQLAGSTDPKRQGKHQCLSLHPPHLCALPQISTQLISSRWASGSTNPSRFVVADREQPINVVLVSLQLTVSPSTKHLPSDRFLRSQHGSNLRPTWQALQLQAALEQQHGKGSLSLNQVLQCCLVSRVQVRVCAATNLL